MTYIELFWNQCLSQESVGTAHHPWPQRHIWEVLMLMAVFLSISVSHLSVFFLFFLLQVYFAPQSSKIYRAQAMSRSPQSDAGHSGEAKTLELVYDSMACHSARHGGDLEVHSPFHFLSVYRFVCLHWGFFQHIFTQSLCLLGSGGILGHITEGRHFHINIQSLC